MGDPSEVYPCMLYWRDNGVHSVVILDWCVCPTVSMVTTPKAVGLEKTDQKKSA